MQQNICFRLSFFLSDKLCYKQGPLGKCGTISNSDTADTTMVCTVIKNVSVMSDGVTSLTKPTTGSNNLRLATWALQETLGNGRNFKQSLSEKD